MHDLNHSARIINDDLNKISEWAYKWKMLFNPDITKQAQEVNFSRKKYKKNHPIVYFNEAPVAHTACRKHLGMHSDEKLNFHKGIGLIRKLAHILPRKSLITVYKSFVRSHLDYGDIIYDQPNYESFCNLIEKIQYNAALAITGAIKGTYQHKLYNELGIESLKFRRWFRRLCVFYKIKSTQIPKYLYLLIPSESHTYNTRNAKFFLIFRNSLLKIGRPMQNPIYDTHDPMGIKFLTRSSIIFMTV